MGGEACGEDCGEHVDGGGGEGFKGCDGGAGEGIVVTRLQKNTEEDGILGGEFSSCAIKSHEWE